MGWENDPVVGEGPATIPGKWQDDPVVPDEPKQLSPAHAKARAQAAITGTYVPPVPNTNERLRAQRQPDGHIAFKRIGEKRGGYKDQYPEEPKPQWTDIPDSDLVNKYKLRKYAKGDTIGEHGVRWFNDPNVPGRGSWVHATPEMAKREREISQKNAPQVAAPPLQRITAPIVNTGLSVGSLASRFLFEPSEADKDRNAKLSKAIEDKLKSGGYSGADRQKAEDAIRELRDYSGLEPEGMADELNRRSRVVSESADKAGSGWLEQTARGAATSLMESLVGGAVAGPAGVYGLPAMTAGNQKYTEAIDNGATEDDARRAAMNSAAINLAIPVAFSKLKIPGVEGIIANGISGKVASEVVKKLGKAVLLEEIPEELITTAVEQAASHLTPTAGVTELMNPDGTFYSEEHGFSPAAQGMVDTIAQTILMGGMAGAHPVAQAVNKDRKDSQYNSAVQGAQQGIGESSQLPNKDIVNWAMRTAMDPRATQETKAKAYELIGKIDPATRDEALRGLGRIVHNPNAPAQEAKPDVQKQPSEDSGAHEKPATLAGQVDKSNRENADVGQEPVGGSVQGQAGIPGSGGVQGNSQGSAVRQGQKEAQGQVDPPPLPNKIRISDLVPEIQLSNSPDWMRESTDQQYAHLKKLGIVESILEQSIIAQKTAEQVVLPDSVGTTKDKKDAVRLVRMKHGVPSRAVGEEGKAFESLRNRVLQEIKQNQSQPTPLPPQLPPPLVQQGPPPLPEKEPLPSGVKFVTSKGSEYSVYQDGTTVRNKSPHPEHPGDVGVKPRSTSTFYVDEEGARKLAEIQSEGMDAKRVLRKLPSGEWGVFYLDGKDAGKFEKRSVTKVSDTPAVGLYPVEVWGDSSPHFGNQIVGVSGMSPPPLPEKEPLPLPGQQAKKRIGKKKNEPVPPVAPQAGEQVGVPNVAQPTAPVSGVPQEADGTVRPQESGETEFKPKDGTLVSYTDENGNVVNGVVQKRFSDSLINVRSAGGKTKMLTENALRPYEGSEKFTVGDRVTSWGEGSDKQATVLAHDWNTGKYQLIGGSGRQFTAYPFEMGLVEKAGDASKAPEPPAQEAQASPLPVFKTYQEAQNALDDAIDAAYAKYGKKPVDAALLNLAMVKHKLPIDEAGNSVPADVIDSINRIRDALDFIDQSEANAAHSAAVDKFKPLISDPDERERFVRKLTKVDNQTGRYLDSQHANEGGGDRQIGELANEILQYIDKKNNPNPSVAFVIDTQYTVDGSRLRLTEEPGLGPLPKSIKEAQRWLDHLLGDQAPKYPGLDTDNPPSTSEQVQGKESVEGNAGTSGEAPAKPTKRIGKKKQPKEPTVEVPPQAAPQAEVPQPQQEAVGETEVKRDRVSQNEEGKLHPAAQQQYDDYLPILEKNLAKETSPRRKVGQFVSVASNLFPAAQDALAKKFSELEPEAYDYAIDEVENIVPLDLKRLFEGKKKVSAWKAPEYSRTTPRAGSDHRLGLQAEQKRYEEASDKLGQEAAEFKRQYDKTRSNAHKKRDDLSTKRAEKDRASREMMENANVSRYQIQQGVAEDAIENAGSELELEAAKVRLARAIEGEAGAKQRMKMISYKDYEAIEKNQRSIEGRAEHNVQAMAREKLQETGLVNSDLDTATTLAVTDIIGSIGESDYIKSGKWVEKAAAQVRGERGRRSVEFLEQTDKYDRYGRATNNPYQELTKEERESFSARIKEAAQDDANYEKKINEIGKEAADLNKSRVDAGLAKAKEESKKKAEEAEKKNEEYRIEARKRKLDRAKQTIYWKRISGEVKKGKEGEFEYQDSEGKKIKTTGEIVGNFGIREIIDDKNEDGSEKAKPEKSYTVTHLGTGLSAGTYDKPSDARQLAYLLDNSGVKFGEKKSQEDFNDDEKKTLGKVARAFDNQDWDSFPDDMRKSAEESVKQHESGIQADKLIGALEFEVDETAKNKGLPIVKGMVKEVPEFAYNPVFTVSDKKMLVFRDGYKFEYLPSVFGLEASELKPGQTVGINLPDLGIDLLKEPEVVKGMLQNAGFSVNKTTKGFSAKWGDAPPVVVTGSGESWTANGTGPNKDRAQKVLDSIRWKQPGQLDEPVKSKGPSATPEVAPATTFDANLVAQPEAEKPAKKPKKAKRIGGKESGEASMAVVGKGEGAPPNSFKTKLKTAYKLSDEQAEAVVAITRAVGLDTSRIEPVRGGVKGADALDQSAYHGTPHNVDKFSMSKVGTGEGAQAYGYGLYFAGNKAVAEHYRDKLSKPSRTIYERMRDLYDSDWDTQDASDAVLESNDFSPIEKEFLKALKNDDWLGFDWPHQAVRAALGKSLSNFDPSPELMSAIEKLNAEEKGNLYHVDLKPAEDEYLLWDKPLSEQSEKVKVAIAGDAKNIGLINEDGSLADWENGDGFYQAVSGSLGESSPNDRAASRYLHSLGIRGIKYLDGNSRFTSGGEIIDVSRGSDGKWRAKIRVPSRSGGHSSPTYDFSTSKPYDTEAEARSWAEDKINGGDYNYVIFDDNDVEILDRLFQDEHLWKDNLLESLSSWQARGTPDQLAAHLNKTKGAAEYAKWIDLDSFLKDKKTVSKSEVEDFVKANQVDVQEVVKGGEKPEIEWASRYSGTAMSPALVDAGEYVLVVDGTRQPGIYDVDEDGKVVHVQGGSRWEYSSVEEAHTAAERIYAKQGDSTQFSRNDLNFPGGDNYRELLLTLPAKSGATIVPHPSIKSAWAIKRPDGEYVEGMRGAISSWSDRDDAEKYGMRYHDTGSFREGHYSEPNVLAHVRFDERTDSDGKRVLFLQEVQSDWHQKGRERGYRGDPIDTDGWRAIDVTNNVGDKTWKVVDQNNDLVLGLPQSEYSQEAAIKKAAEWLSTKETGNKLPNAPFKSSWPMLAMKRMIRWAADNGYDRVAWTTGEQQAKRYDLSKKIDSNGIQWSKQWGAYSLYATSAETGSPIFYGDMFTASELPANVGKEIANQIISANTDMGQITGDNLKVGGEGMVAFYDKMLPSKVNDFVKKWGVKTGKTEIETPRDLEYGWDEDQQAYYVFNVKNGEELAQEDGQPMMFENEEDAIDAIHKESGPSKRIVHSVDITPEMKAEAKKGMPLFQGPKGSAEFLEGGKAIIRGLAKPDVSTAIHEVAHVIRRFLVNRDVKQEYRAGITNADIKTVEDWAGAKDGKWDRPAEEKFARGFERYLRDGNAPTEKLKALFGKFANWLGKIYKTLSGSPIDVDISPEVKAFFDKLVTRTDAASKNSGPSVRQTRSLLVRKPGDEAPGVSAADIHKTWSRMFGITTRVGQSPHFSGPKGKRAAGLYNFLTEVLRTDEPYVNELAVLAHEIAHHIDNVGKVTNTKGDALNDAPDSANSELQLFDYDQRAARVYEGWAEYLRNYITEDNLNAIKARAPVFSEWFENTWMKQNPALAEKIKEARRQALSFADQSVFQRISAALGRAGVDLDRAERWKDYASSRMGQFNHDWRDDKSVLKDAEAELDKLNVSFSDRASPYEIAAVFSGVSNSMAEKAYLRGVHSIVDPGKYYSEPAYEEGLLRNSVEFDEAINYGHAKRLLWIRENHIPGYESHMTPQEAQKIVDYVESDPAKFSRYERARLLLSRFYQGLIKMEADAGARTRESADAILTKHGDDYYPMVHLPRNEGRSGFVKKGFVNPINFLKRLSQKGSGEPLVNPYDYALERATQAYRAAADAQVNHALLNEYSPLYGKKQAGFGYLLEVVPPEKNFIKGNLLEVLPQAIQAGMISQTDARAARIAAKLRRPGGHLDVSASDYAWFAKRHGIDPKEADYRELVAAAEKEPDYDLDFFLDRKTYQGDPDKYTVRMVDPNGEYVMVAMDKMLYQATMGMDQKQVGTFIEVLRSLTNLVKFGSVNANLQFAGRNVQRDLPDALASHRHTKGVADSVKKTVGALGAVFMHKVAGPILNKSGVEYNNALLQLMDEYGGRMFTKLGNTRIKRRNFRKSVTGRSQHESADYFRRGVEAAQNAVESVVDFLSYGDAINRLPDMQAALENMGYTPKNGKWYKDGVETPLTQFAIVRALNAFANGTINFKTAGTKAREHNQIHAFFNVWIRGLDKNLEQFLEAGKEVSAIAKQYGRAMTGQEVEKAEEATHARRLGKRWARRYLTLLAANIAGGVGYGWWKSDDDEYLDALEKEANKSVQIGPVNLALGFLLPSRLFALSARMSSAAFRKDKPISMVDEFIDFAKSEAVEMGPPLPGGLPAGVLDAIRNKDYNDRPIEQLKDQFGNKPSVLRTNRNVNWFDKQVSRFLYDTLGAELSPAKFNHIMNSSLGGLYNRDVRFIDRALHGDLERGDVPFLGSFLYDRKGSQSQQEFYANLMRLKNSAGGDRGNPSHEQLVEFETASIYEAMMSVIRDKDELDRNGNRVGKYDGYLTGLARASLGWGELATKKNPLMDSDLPKDIKDELLKEIREMVQIAYHGAETPKSGHNGKSLEETMARHQVKVDSYRKFLEQNKDSALVKSAKSAGTQKEGEKYMEERRKRLGKLLR